MTGEISNLRIHFYGVQGSGSIFPVKSERDLIREMSDIDLLEKLFLKLQGEKNSSDNLDFSVEDLLGGPISKESLNRFRTQLAPKEQPVYGGWTSCFRIETSDGHDIVIDCGSGFRRLAQDLETKWGDSDHRQLTILGSHAHFDHTEGFDQSNICFDPRNHIHFIANRSYLLSLDRYLGIFSKQANRRDEGRPTPLTYEQMPATFESTEIIDFSNKVKHPKPLADRFHDRNKPFSIGKTTIQAFDVFHPDPCLAFRIEHNGKVFVYCTDHELRHGINPEFHLQIASLDAEQRLLDYSMDADVLYRDGQFLRAEYDGEKPLGGDIGVSRRDWGHSCIEDVVEMAKKANVTHTYIGHHDPNRSWEELNSIDAMLREESKQTGIRVELAKAETVIDL